MKKIIYIIIITLIIVGLIYTKIKENKYEEIKIEETNINNIEEKENELIKIHIAGAVILPGVIELNEGSRITDAIEMAGGLAEEANIRKINLAKKIEDGEKIYIPYIGVVPVSTAEFMGHKISVKMLVDYTTGAATAIVFKDDIPFIYRNGVVGISIPMTGTDSSTYANTVIGNVVSGVSQIATAGIGGATTFDSAKSAGGKIGAVTSGASGIVGGLENIYSGFATPVQYQSASASSPSVATWQPQKCYFIIDRPILNVPDNYGRTVGYACEQTGKLSDFKGFTVISNPEINFKCTDNERQYMINMLQGGVFV